jgi:ataxia telangiectasia mutated family protein
MAERSVHLISRKPFIALFTHMTHLLVFASTIFPPAALDYAKALRSVLSYPPHLENLDQQGWKILMGICWAAVLGDPVTVDDEWQEDNESESVNQGKGFNDISTQNPLSSRTTSTVSQSTTELVSLIPILLSSTAAPLISPLPPVGPGWISETSLGHSILLKIHRFFLLHPTETSAHLPILRSMNIVLTELELNCRADFVSAGIKLFPQLVEFWGTRDRGLREQVLIALKTLLPYLTHKVAAEKDKAGVIREAMNSLMEALPREASSRSGIRPLDFGVLRLKEYVRNVKAGTSDCWQPFESITMSVRSFAIDRWR